MNPTIAQPTRAQATHQRIRSWVVQIVAPTEPRAVYRVRPVAFYDRPCTEVSAFQRRG
jgi:hypothetical protein